MQAMSQGMISAKLAAQPLRGRMYGLLFVLVKPVVDLDAHGAVPVRTRLRFVPAMCSEVVRPGVALLASEPLVEGVGSALSTFVKASRSAIWMAVRQAFSGGGPTPRRFEPSSRTGGCSGLSPDCYRQSSGSLHASMECKQYT